MSKKRRKSDGRNRSRFTPPPINCREEIPTVNPPLLEIPGRVSNFYHALERDPSGNGYVQRKIFLNSQDIDNEDIDDEDTDEGFDHGSVDVDGIDGDEAEPTQRSVDSGTDTLFHQILIKIAGMVGERIAGMVEAEIANRSAPHFASSPRSSAVEKSTAAKSARQTR